MFIVDFVRSEVINLNHIVKIFMTDIADEYGIVATTADQKRTLLGKYSTKERATEVFDEILRDELKPQTKGNFYYMPVE